MNVQTLPVSACGRQKLPGRLSPTLSPSDPGRDLPRRIHPHNLRFLHQESLGDHHSGSPTIIRRALLVHRISSRILNTRHPRRDTGCRCQLALKETDGRSGLARLQFSTHMRLKPS